MSCSSGRHTTCFDSIICCEVEKKTDKSITVFNERFHARNEITATCPSTVLAASDGKNENRPLSHYDCLQHFSLLEGLAGGDRGGGRNTSSKRQALSRFVGKLKLDFPQGLHNNPFVSVITVLTWKLPWIHVLCLDLPLDLSRHLSEESFSLAFIWLSLPWTIRHCALKQSWH